MSLTRRTIVALLVGPVLAGCSAPTQPVQVTPSPAKEATQSIWSIEDAEQRQRVSISVEVTPNTLVLGDDDITVVAMGIFLTNHEDNPVTLTSARVTLTIRPVHGAVREMNFNPQTISLAPGRILWWGLEVPDYWFSPPDVYHLEASLLGYDKSPTVVVRSFVGRKPTSVPEAPRTVVGQGRQSEARE